MDMNELIELMKHNNNDGCWAVLADYFNDYQKALTNNKFAEAELNYQVIYGFLWGLKFAGYINDSQREQLTNELIHMPYACSID